MLNSMGRSVICIDFMGSFATGFRVSNKNDFTSEERSSKNRTLPIEYFFIFMTFSKFDLYLSVFFLNIFKTF